MKLIVNHKGEQSLIVTKPDAAVLKKSRPLIRLACMHFGIEVLQASDFIKLLDSTIDLANKDSTDGQHELLEAGEDDPPAVGQ